MGLFASIDDLDRQPAFKLALPQLSFEELKVGDRALGSGEHVAQLVERLVALSSGFRRLEHLVSVCVELLFVDLARDVLDLARLAPHDEVRRAVLAHPRVLAIGAVHGVRDLRLRVR